MIQNLLGSVERENIEKLINKYDKNINEFEVSLFSNRETSEDLLTRDKFDSLNSVLTIINKSKNREIINSQSLDISLVIKEEDKIINYRISISGSDKINMYLNMLHQRTNHLVYSIIVRFIFDKTNKNNIDDMKIIKKTKYFNSYVTLEDIYTRVKMDSEEELTEDEIEKLMNCVDYYKDSLIFFRYKERTTYVITEDKNIFHIDLTRVKSANNMNKINNGLVKREIEIECLINDKKTIYDQMFKYIEFIIKNIQGSNHIVTKSLTEKIINKYMNVLGVTNNRFFRRNPIALEVQYLVNNLQNKYSVTDKADGERYQLIVVDEKCYLINSSLAVINIGLNASKQFNNSILDGEYIYITKKKKYIYMVFDCLTMGSTDVRDKNLFVERIKYADMVVENLNETKFKYSELENKLENKININDLDKVTEYHVKNIKNFYEDLNNYLNLKNNSVIVRRKYFMCVNGIQNNEIFKYSSKMWELYLSNVELNCPYTLDGMIFQPLNQKYVVEQSMNKYPEYKFKPPHKNSIDFLVKFEFDKNTGKPMKVYDNSIEGNIKNKKYNVAKLYVGLNINGVTKPVLFKYNENLYDCYLNLDDMDMPRSLDGKIIEHNTVVEFYYELNHDKQYPFRWIPIKTRYDKTEEMIKYGRQFGNAEATANKNWNSINNPILPSDLNELANDKLYEHAFDKLYKRIDYNMATSELKSDIYYQKKSKLTTEMGKFNNYIKSNIIYTYCNVYYSNNIKNKILDIACGRGGDIQKFYYAVAKYVVGTDVDLGTLQDPQDGPISRYEREKKKHRDYPEMKFIHADSSIPYNFDEQNTALGGMTFANEKLFKQYFDGKTIFDRINCSFAIHYFFKNESTWNSFCSHINTYLREGGVFTFTTFDGEIVYNKLKDTSNYVEHYMDNGDSKVLFDIVKKYDDNDKNELGRAIDVHMAWISDTYMTEYLVFPKFIINSLKEKCNMELIETDTFENAYNGSKTFLELASKHDVHENKSFFQDVYSFYGDTPFLDKCRNYSFLNRYYVFKKKETNLEENRKKYYMAEKYIAETRIKR